MDRYRVGPSQPWQRGSARWVDPMPRWRSCATCGGDDRGESAAHGGPGPTLCGVRTPARRARPLRIPNPESRRGEQNSYPNLRARRMASRSRIRRTCAHAELSTPMDSGRDFVLHGKPVEPGVAPAGGPHRSPARGVSRYAHGAAVHPHRHGGAAGSSALPVVTTRRRRRQRRALAADQEPVLAQPAGGRAAQRQPRVEPRARHLAAPLFRAGDRR